jgi:hypothetical protein
MADWACHDEKISGQPIGQPGIFNAAANYPFSTPRLRALLTFVVSLFSPFQLPVSDAVAWLHF